MELQIIIKEVEGGKSKTFRLYDFKSAAKALSYIRSFIKLDDPTKLIKP